MKMISNGMAIIGMLFILVWVMPASADSYTLPFIEFDPGAYSWESNRSGYISQPGSQLSVVGLISRMYCPLPEPPYGPEREYTLYLTGIADGTTVTPIGFVTNYETDYSNVEFFVYEDNTPDAPSLSAMPTNPPNAAVPNAFTDGALILSGTGSFSIGTSVLTLPTITIVTGGFGGNFAVTGGLRFCIVGAVAGYMQGSLDPRQSYLPAGYSGKLDGRFVGSYDYPTVSPPPCYLISVFPACAQRGIVFYEPGRGFTPDAYVELHFIKPDGTPDLPNPIEHTDACGRFQHLYNSSTASQYGVYQYYAVDLATGRQSGTVQFKILSPNQADRPVPPTNVQIENPGTGTTLKLSWSPSTSQFVERYRVYRWQTGSPVTLAGTPTTTSFEDQGLIRGQEYYYAVSAADCVGEGLLSGAVPGTPQYYPVVLVHGICSDADMWNQLKPYLEQQGYAVHTVNLVPNDERPHIVTSILEQKIQEVAGDEPVSIVAHSMGGLVARIASKNLYEMTGRSWIRTLITLGTPHHGSDLTGLVVGNAFYRGLTTEAFPFGCAPHAPAFWDLIPGSDLLNTLNYGYGGDEFGESSEGDHDPERVDDPSLRVVTIAGTKPANFVQRILFAEAWATSNFGRRYGIPEYLNDGAIGIDAARMYGTQSENYTDQGLGLPSITHSASTGSPYFSESSELASVIAQILRGEALQAVANAQGALATTEATSDTMLVDLSIASGSIGVGEIVEQNVQVATTTFLRVFMVSEGARLFLRSPADSLITPGDTLSTPGLQYVYDPILGLEGYLFENPPAGQWTVRIDATGSSGPQEYATAISIASTKAPTVTVEPRPVYDATPVQVLASVRELGTPIPDVTWLCTVIRPDSTTVALTLYDDGAHGDGLGSDGVFGTTFVPAGPIGFYRLEATVTLQDGTTLVTGTAMESAVFQDLATDSTLSFSRNSVIAGDSLQISATIRNLGNNALQGVRVEFWDDATLFAVDSMDIPGGGTDLASATWVAASPDSHTFRVTVNPFTSPPEATYLNNSAFKGIVLGQPIVGVTGSDASRTYLATPWPNPSKGGTTVRFSLAMPGPASLVIYDIAGRRIRSWKWDQLPAGSQTITWDGRTDHGSTAASGVYFVKLVVSGASPTRTVVLLR